MQGYVCGKTKTTYEAVAPILKQELVSHGSSDTGLKKMNPIGVHLYDINLGKVVSRLLDMGCTSGVQAATAATIVLSENVITQYLLRLKCTLK